MTPEEPSDPNTNKISANSRPIPNEYHEGEQVYEGEKIVSDAPTTNNASKEMIGIMKWVALGFVVFAIPGLLDLFGGGPLSGLVLIIYMAIAIPSFVLVFISVVMVKLLELYPILGMGSPARRSPWNIWFWLIGGAYVLIFVVNSYAKALGDTSDLFQQLNTSPVTVYAPYISAFAMASLVTVFIVARRPKENRLYLALTLLASCLLVFLI